MMSVNCLCVLTCRHWQQLVIHQHDDPIARSGGHSLYACESTESREDPAPWPQVEAGKRNGLSSPAPQPKARMDMPIQIVSALRRLGQLIMGQDESAQRHGFGMDTNAKLVIVGLLQDIMVPSNQRKPNGSDPADLQPERIPF